MDMIQKFTNLKVYTTQQSPMHLYAYSATDPTIMHAYLDDMVHLYLKNVLGVVPWSGLPCDSVHFQESICCDGYDLHDTWCIEAKWVYGYVGMWVCAPHLVPVAYIYAVHYSDLCNTPDECTGDYIRNV